MAHRPRPDPLWVNLEIDQFAAQALEATRPDLRSRPFVVVHQSADSHKAAVQAVSTRAGDLDIRPGVPVFVMRRRHSGRVAVVDRDEAAEAACAESLSVLLERWTPQFRVRQGWARLSALLDLSGTPQARHQGWQCAGDELQRQVKEATSLVRVAVGVSASRLVARALARESLPDAVGACPPGDEPRVLARLELDGLPGLGSACRERAEQYGIRRVDQVLSLDRQALQRRLGRSGGERLYALVRGLEGEGRVDRPTTVEAETVLRHDINDDGLLREAVAITVDRTCHRLRERGLAAGALTLCITYTDNRRAQRTRRLASTTDELAPLAAAAERLFTEVHVRRVAVKSIAAIAGRTSPATGQADLFDGAQARRRRRLGAAITDIRRRMGFEAVVGAGALELRDGT